MNGRALSPRRTVYLIASLSGLRRKELRRLEKRDCTPTGEKATWHLRPEIDKAGRGDKIPMLPECAEILLPIWESAPTPTSRLFKRISHTSVLHNDLKRVGIPRQDERGLSQFPLHLLHVRGEEIANPKGEDADAPKYDPAHRRPLRSEEHTSELQ